MGLYPAPGPKPLFEIPGMEFAGRIVDVGERVTGWTAGDEVMGIVSAGAAAERVATHERMLQRIPAGVALRDAAAIPEVFHDGARCARDPREGSLRAVRLLFTPVHQAWERLPYRSPRPSAPASP